MKALLAIAHYTSDRTPEGASTLARCVLGWRSLASWGEQDFGGPCRAVRAIDLDILVVDDGQHSAAEYLPTGLAERVSLSVAPLHLPLACRQLLDERRAHYDLIGYSEHDNWPITADFFARIAQHAARFPDRVLIPHRFERIGAPPYKVYIDGENGWGAYGAMWVLTAAQWEHWRSQPHFLTYSEALAGPLESGCAWSLMQTFLCEKPATMSKLESEHAGDRYAARSVARGIVWMG